jgi:putative PIN family toxin of toxin-antitoxin system
MPNLQPGRLRGVVDASTLVGAMLRPRSVPRQAVEMLLEDYVVVLSTDILAEVTEVLRRPKFDRHAPIEDRIAFLTFFLVRTLVVEVTTEVTACRDPTDANISPSPCRPRRTLSSRATPISWRLTRSGASAS